MNKIKFAFVVSQPIHYQVPIFRILSENEKIDFKAIFMWNFAVADNPPDPEFGEKITWDIPILDGYKYRFLRNFSPRKSNSFWGLINPGIVKEIYEGKYDFIFFHGWNSLSNWLGILTAIFMRIPFSLHGDNCFLGEEDKNIFKKILKKLVLGTLFKFPTAFMYIGEENKKFYEYYGADKSKFFFMPFSSDSSYLLKKKVEINREIERDKLGLSGSITLLFSGKLVPRKRPMDLLIAFKELKKVLPDEVGSKVKLLFMGEGVLRREMEDFIQRNQVEGVSMLGFQNLTELPKYYAVADVFVMPSFNEAWGLVVNEAMYFDLPVVASDLVGSVPNLVLNGENGFVYKCGDVSDLVQKLKPLILDNDLRKVFGLKSKEIIKKYTMEEDAEAILKMLEKVVRLK